VKKRRGRDLYVFIGNKLLPEIEQDGGFTAGPRFCPGSRRRRGKESSDHLRKPYQENKSVASSVPTGFRSWSQTTAETESQNLNQFYIWLEFQRRVNSSVIAG
jgi:hypothetical protein